MSIVRHLAALLLLALAGCTRPAPQEPLYLGHLETGSDSCKNGVQLAIKEANEAEGQIAGRRIAILNPNFTTSEETIAAVATRLVTVNRVPVLVTGPDLTHLESIGRAAQSAAAMVVIPGSVPLTKLGDNVFPARLSPEDQGALLARYAEDIKADRAALVVRPRPEKAEGETIQERFAAAFARQWSKHGSARPLDRFALSDKPDWPSLLKEILAKEPKVLVLAGLPSDLAEARKALKQTTPTIPVLFGTDPAMPLDLEALQGAHVATPDETPADPAAREFAGSYRKEFKEAPDDAARLGYDAARVVIGALRRSRLLSRDRLREEVTKGFVVRLEDGKATEARAYKLPGR